MTECTDQTMQDLLPLDVRGALAAGASARVRAHVAGCASCAAERAVLETAGALFASLTPQVDTARIAASLPAAPAAPVVAPRATSRPVLRLGRTARRAFTLPRYALAAAASLLLVATISFAGLRAFFADDLTVSPDSAGNGALVALAVPVELVGAGGLADLESDELRDLLLTLDEMELTVASEPVGFRRPVTILPEGG